MRKIFLPLTIILLLLFCAPAFAQKIKPPADCNVSAGEITVTHSSPTIKCPGVNSTTLVLNGNDEGDIVWFSSVDGEIWELVEGVTGTQYVASNLLDTTYFIVEVRNGPGTCWGYSNIVRISISMPVWYKDGDGDHYADTVHQCTKPGIGYTITPIAPPGDCNDSDGSIHPGAPEIIDGIDNDCDGSIDEGYSNTGFEDVIIPNGISSIAITVQGAKGGSIKKQDTHGGDLVGSPAIVASGGRGARLNAKFRVETDCQQGLKPGGKLRFIIGGTPDAIIRNQEVPSLPGAAPTSSGQGGGGGTAILYQAPGTSSWVLLAVAGGGGGAFSRNDGLNSFNSNGIAAIQPGFNLTTTGPDGMGGKGIFIQQIIPDDDPRDGGQIIIINISGGGGGAFGDATQSCGGKKGMDEGGTSTICTSGSAGGYGFGAGGSGISRLDNPSTPADNEEGGGGGGGGYSGGNGGGNATGGFGGGSYISDLAFESSWLTSSSADNGSIIIETNPIDNSDCCDPESLAFTGSYADVNLGCNPADPDASLGTATATDASGAVTITSTDGPVISDGCNRSRTRTFTATDGCNNTVTTSRTVRWVADLTPPSFTDSYAEVNLGCNPANPDGSLGSASATDVCGAVTITSSDGAVQSNGCNRSRTRTFTATDGCLNTSTTSRTVRWIYDVTAPTLTSGGSTLTLGWNPNVDQIEAALGTATATDACSNPTVTPSNGSVTGDCLKSQTRTFRAIDACGNISTVSREVTWKFDLTVPTVNCPSNQTVNLSPNCTASLPNYISLATASDNCTVPGSITITQYPAAETPLSGTGTQTVTLTATDEAGNTATCSFTVNKVDNTPPVINNASPGICVLSPPNHKMRDVTVTYTTSDACGPVSSSLQVSSNEPISGTGDGDTAPDWEVIDNHNVKLRAERSGSGDGRVYTITITATDASGNTSTSSVEVRVTHNITSPQSGKSFKVGSTVNLEGEFWDKAGNKHSATWLIDDNTTVKGTVTEPTATKNGKVTGSYKFTAPGVYKLQMNTKDQNNVVSYANTSGDVDAIIVIYDPNGGYTYGGGYFNSPAGAVTSNASATGKGSYGFSVNYFKGATYPKGETQFDFKVGEFEFNALNFEYLSIAGAKAQMKGTGKIIGGQSGINFILTVTDGQLDGTGIDRIRMKIYNKNTMEVYYDNQPGASDAVNPTVPVQENSTVVISGSNNSNLTQSNQVTTNVEQEVAPLADGLQVKVIPNPSSTNFRIVVNSNDLKAPVKLLITDMLGRVIETRITNAGQTITIGDKYISGAYAVRILQGRKTKQLTLIKLSD